MHQPIWVAATMQQAYDNLTLSFTRCLQPCDDPLQGAHSLVKVLYKLYNLA